LGLSSILSFSRLFSNFSSYFFDFLWCCLSYNFFFWWNFFGHDNVRLSGLWLNSRDFLNFGWLFNLGLNNFSGCLDFFDFFLHRWLFLWNDLLVLNWWCLRLDSNWLLFSWRSLCNCL
jgi:hypothetical protein